MSIGSLIVKLSMNTGEFETDAKRAAKIAERRAREIDKAFNDAARKLGVGVAAAMAATATAIGVAVSRAIEDVDKLNDMSVKFGIDLKNLQELKFIAGQTGTDIDTLGKGVQRMAKVMSAELGGAATVFDKLGISVKGVDGNLKAATQILPEIANRFASLSDPMQKAALAQELFGKSGVELIPLLEQGGAGLDAMRQRAEELGLVLSDSAVAAIAELDDKLQELSAVGDSFAQKLAADLAPIITSLIDDFIEWATEGDNLQTVVEVLTDIVSAGIDVFKALGSVMGAVSDVAIALGRVFFSAGDDVNSAADVITNAINAITATVTVASSVLSAFANTARAVVALSQGDIDGFNKYDAAVTAAGNRGNSALLTYSDYRFGSFNSGSSADPKKASGGGFSIPNIGGGSRLRPAPRRSGGGGTPRRTGPDPAELLRREIEETRRAMDGWKFEQDKFANEVEAEWKRSVDETAKKVEELKKLKADPAFIAEFEAAALKQRRFERTQTQTRQQQGNIDLIKSLEDERAALFLTNEQLAVNNNLARLNEHATEEQKQQVTALTLELMRMTELRGLADSFGQSFMSAFDAIIDGSKSAKDAFGDMLEDMAKMALRFVMQKAIQTLITSVFNAAWAKYDPAGMALATGQPVAFAEGGYTGDGHKYQPAGIVHAGEYVINAQSTKRLGLGFLNRLNGYANGGYVTPVSAGGQHQVNVNVYQNAGKNAVETSGTNGNLNIDVYIDQAVGRSMMYGTGAKVLKSMGVRKGGTVRG